MLVLKSFLSSSSQESALPSSLNGTPGHQPALIPPVLVAPVPSIGLPIVPPALTVQDRLMTPPVYNGVNPNYPGLRVVNTSPPMFAVDSFLTPFECEFLVRAAQVRTSGVSTSRLLSQFANCISSTTDRTLSRPLRLLVRARVNSRPLEPARPVILHAKISLT